jgi:hypothetical protein
VEHPTSAESNTTTNYSKHFTALSKRCHPKHRHKTRPSDFPPCLRLQPTAINVPSSNSTRSFQLSWPGPNASLVTKHLPKSLATSKGHLRMQQKNIQSTKITTDLPLATLHDFSPSHEPQNNRTYVIFTAILPATELEKLYSDQTGKFPVQSSCGYNCVMLLYDYNSNVILSKPLKTKPVS